MEDLMMTLSRMHLFAPILVLQALVCSGQSPVARLLQSHIDQANASEFKKIHTQKSKWHLPLQLYYAPQAETERAQREVQVTVHQHKHETRWKQHNTTLLAHSQQLREKLSQELAVVKDGTIHTESALKGTLQAYGSICGLLSAGLALSIFITQVLCYQTYHTKGSAKQPKWQQMKKSNSFTLIFRNILKTSKIFYPAVITSRLIQE